MEGSEDSEELGESEIAKHHITEDDVVVGIAASGRTPYVIGVIRKARKVGAYTIGVTTNSQNMLEREVDICIAPVVGPEVVTGSTRSDTAECDRYQKLFTGSWT